MAISSINVKPVKSNSEAHNNRTTKLDYNYPDLEKNNESWQVDSIHNRLEEIHKSCKQISGRAMRKSATPIREAVVNLNANHTMADLKKLAVDIKQKFDVEVFQIHIHRDEGESREDLNYHAHLVLDWQDKQTKKMKRHGRASMSQLQTLVADSLGMERGELKENSNRERLEPIEYKRQQEEIKLKLLQEQVEVLEQKKNRAADRNRIAKQRLQDIRERNQNDPQNERFKQRSTQLATEGVAVYRSSIRGEHKELNRAIEQQLDGMEGTRKRIHGQEKQYRDYSTLAESIEKIEVEIDGLEDGAKYYGAIRKLAEKDERIRMEIEAFEKGG